MMLVKLLHDLVEELAGAETGRIVNILFGKKDVNEFLISKKMELTINQVRNILYKLHAEGLVSFIRKKDKRKGWYIYYWTLKVEKCLVKLEQSLISKISNLEGVSSSRETGRFYICKPCAIEVGEDKALENDFTCEECAEVYVLSDNSGPLRETKARIAKTERDLKLIKGELEKIREKETKRRARADKKLAKETSEKKAILKAARAAARAKVAGAKKKVVRAKGRRPSTDGHTKGRRPSTDGKKVVKKKVAKKTAKKTVKKVAKNKTAVKKKVVKKAVKKKAVKKKVGILSRLKKVAGGK